MAESPRPGEDGLIRRAGELLLNGALAVWVVAVGLASWIAWHATDLPYFVIDPLAAAVLALPLLLRPRWRRQLVGALRERRYDDEDAVEELLGDQADGAGRDVASDEAPRCPPNYHWDDAIGGCVPDGGPETGVREPLRPRRPGPTLIAEADSDPAES